MSFVTKEPINKGWSSDKKYCVTDENGTRYFLRVSDIAQHDMKQSEFNKMKQVATAKKGADPCGDRWEYPWKQKEYSPLISHIRISSAEHPASSKAEIADQVDQKQPQAHIIAHAGRRAIGTLHRAVPGAASLQLPQK